MSWETIESERFSVCACGKGRVVQRVLERSDDWNRREVLKKNEEILCAECKEKYHIEHLVRHYPCFSWDGDGVSDRVFLVPNGVEMPPVIAKKDFSFSTVEERIVSSMPLKTIKACIDDMLANKYSTRMQLNDSHRIVALFEKYRKTKSLKRIIPVLDEIVQNYDNYKWTPESIEEYKKQEKVEIQKNEQVIQKVISQSYELYF